METAASSLVRALGSFQTKPLLRGAVWLRRISLGPRRDLLRELESPRLVLGEVIMLEGVSGQSSVYLGLRSEGTEAMPVLSLRVASLSRRVHSAKGTLSFTVDSNEYVSCGPTALCTFAKKPEDQPRMLRARSSLGSCFRTGVSQLGSTLLDLTSGESTLVDAGEIGSEVIPGKSAHISLVFEPADFGPTVQAWLLALEGKPELHVKKRPKLTGTALAVLNNSELRLSCQSASLTLDPPDDNIVITLR